MNLIVRIPEDVAGRLTEGGGDLERRALEALLVEEYRAGRLTKPELRQALGLGTRWQLDGVLKAHEVFEDYTLAEFERERQELARLGF